MSLWEDGFLDSLRGDLKMHKLQLMSFIYSLILGSSSGTFAGPPCRYDTDCQELSESCCNGVCSGVCYGGAEKKSGKHGR